MKYISKIIIIKIKETERWVFEKMESLVNLYLGLSKNKIKWIIRIKISNIKNEKGCKATNIIAIQRNQENTIVTSTNWTT